MNLPFEEEKHADGTLASVTPGGTIPSNEFEPPPMTTEGCSIEDDYRDEFPPESAHSMTNLMQQKSKFMSNQLPDIKSETELQTHSNKHDESKMESHGSRGSHEGAPPNFQMLADDSDSDMGLPPPLPIAGSRPGLGLSLALGGLGLSTVAQDGGKTAEQMADEETYKNAVKQRDKAGSESSDTSEEGEMTAEAS
mmetsp:Transcript_26470/g.40405  ORF Transcript_26470/g.40405 Transcript_26470/m.40405 type:complete len:195 (-) Transcript_26470:6192-6776(-)